MTGVDRGVWLAERRAAVTAAYDAFAPEYDADDRPLPPIHRSFVERLLAMTPPGGRILDTPCGTGRYFPLVAASGRTVVGADQSPGMLERARSRGIADALHQRGLQELAFDGEFDGVMTIDSMEHVPPEEWPGVVAALRRAVRPGGVLYLTVEETDQAEIEAAYAELRRRGLPAVRGEVIEGDVGGYHFYPSRDQVDRWLDAEGLDIVDHATETGEGWAYRHLLLRVRQNETA